MPPSIKPGTHAIDFGGGHSLWLDEDGRLQVSTTPPTVLNQQTNIISPFPQAAPGGIIVMGGEVLSPIIDLTTTGVYQILPPMPYRFNRSTGAWRIREKGGTVSVNPTWQIGTNAAVDDVNPSNTPTGFTTAVVNQEMGAPTAFATTFFWDLSQFGLRVQVTAPATGTNPVLKAQFRQNFLGLIPLSVTDAL